MTMVPFGLLYSLLLSFDTWAEVRTRTAVPYKKWNLFFLRKIFNRMCFFELIPKLHWLWLGKKNYISSLFLLPEINSSLKIFGQHDGN